MGLWVEIGGFMGCLWWHWVCGLRSVCLWVVYGGVLLGGWWVFVCCGNCGFMHLPVVSYASILFVFVTFVCSLSLSRFRCWYCESCLISFALSLSLSISFASAGQMWVLCFLWLFWILTKHNVWAPLLYQKKLSLTSEICTWEQDPNKNLLELWKK